jgi:hypothetical protein
VSKGPEFFRGDDPGSYRDDSEPPGEFRRSEKEPRSSALDQVLQETLELLSREKITPAEVEALRDVARRYRAQALEAEPVTRELVSALLEKRFRLVAQTDRDRQQMAREIAEFLHDTPTTLQKLQEFWRRLQETLQ